MRWWQCLEFPHPGFPLGKEHLQVNAVSFRDLFDGADAYSQNRTGFKALVILKRQAD
jgi:hypothetical protein